MTYTWDARNRLTGISGPSGTASFKYDALGRRIEKTVNGQTVQYLYDGNQAIAELQGSAIGATYLTGLQIDEVLARYGASGDRTLIADALGSVLAQTDGAGAVQTQYSYSPYGETQTSGTADGNPVQYTGRENDQTGLYYYRARYYDPQLKRFISEDPIGLGGGVNQYSYVDGNPISLVDPTGLYGTQSCSYYGQACSANQGTYECKVAPELCPRFPNNDDPTGNSDKIGNWSECVRQCLQERNRNRMPYPQQCSPANNISPGDNKDDHLDCWSGCYKNPENPYNRSGPNLPDGFPRLY